MPGAQPNTIPEQEEKEEEEEDEEHGRRRSEREDGLIDPDMCITYWYGCTKHSPAE